MAERTRSSSVEEIAQDLAALTINDRMSKVEGQLAENTQQLGELAKMLKSFMSAKQPEMAEASNSASKHTGKEEADAHSDRVTCVRFFPSALAPVVVSGSWDRTVKVWDLANCTLRHTLTGHNGHVNVVAVSPDGSICASGGRDGVILLWDLAEGKCLYSFDVGASIHSFCFNPKRYWLCGAPKNSVTIWDLESKSILQDIDTDQMLDCTSLNWSVDGNTLFTGSSDGTIRVWEFGVSQVTTDSYYS